MKILAINTEKDTISTISSEKITRIRASNLDRLVQILEISFIFLLSYSLITLINVAFIELDFYQPISNSYLGEENVGSLYGGHFETIVSLTLIFNFALFVFSLIFGLWIRKTRDNWSFKDMGYTLKTSKYTTKSIFRRAVLLGLIAIAIWYTVLTTVEILFVSGDINAALKFHVFAHNGILFTVSQLPAEYYFGIIEMGFIWPASAGFFFFAYTHNSLKARFPIGIANILSSLFYVFYLLFFFMILGPGKLSQMGDVLTDPSSLGALVAFFIILYIAFSAFAETESVLLPFLFTFVLNVGLTIFKSFNALYYDELTVLMLIPYFLVLVVIGVWYYLKKEDFSTIKLGIKHLVDIVATPEDIDDEPKNPIVSSLIMFGFFLLFILLSFIVPGLLEQLVADYRNAVDSGLPFNTELFGLGYAFIYIMVIGVAIIVLTYEPTQVHDVLLVKQPDGIPLVSKIKLFQSDEVLISGFFTAISSVSQELGDSNLDKSELRSIKRGDREILIEDGVHTRIIALVDRDQSKIRQNITLLQRDFEKKHSQEVISWLGDLDDVSSEAKDLVENISSLKILFDIPQQTRWLSVLTLVLTPIMVALLAFI